MVSLTVESGFPICEVNLPVVTDREEVVAELDGADADALDDSGPGDLERDFGFLELAEEIVVERDIGPGGSKPELLALVREDNGSGALGVVVRVDVDREALEPSPMLALSQDNSSAKCLSASASQFA